VDNNKIIYLFIFTETANWRKRKKRCKRWYTGIFTIIYPVFHGACYKPAPEVFLSLPFGPYEATLRVSSPRRNGQADKGKI